MKKCNAAAVFLVCSLACVLELSLVSCVASAYSRQQEIIAIFKQKFMPVTNDNQTNRGSAEARERGRAMDKPRAILVILFNALGDFILQTQSLKTLRDAYPDARMDAVAGSRNHAMARESGLFDHVHVLDKNNFFPAWLLAARLRAVSYDLLIDTWYEDYPTVMRIIVKYCGARRKIGIKTLKPSHMEHWGLSDKKMHFAKRHFDAVLAPLAGVHFKDSFDPVLRELGIPGHGGEIFIKLSPEMLEKASRWLQNQNAPRILISCEGSRRENTFAVGQILEMTARLRQSAADPTVYLMSKAPEKGRPVADLVADKFNTNRVVSVPAYDASLDFAMACLSKMDLVISSSTAALHMASALKVPVIGIFYERLEEFAPLGTRTAVIRCRSAGSVHDFSIEETVRAAGRLLAVQPVSASE